MLVYCIEVNRPKQNTCRTMSHTGVVAPMVTGFVVGSTHSFVDAFLVAGLVLIAGVAAFVFLLGRIEPLSEPA